MPLPLEARKDQRHSDHEASHVLPIARGEYSPCSVLRLPLSIRESYRRKGCPFRVKARPRQNISISSSNWPFESSVAEVSHLRNDATHDVVLAARALAYKGF